MINDSAFINDLIDFIQTYMDTSERERRILGRQMMPDEVYNAIDFSGSNETIAAHFVQTMLLPQHLATTPPALVTYLKRLKEQVGVNVESTIDTFIQRIEARIQAYGATFFYWYLPFRAHVDEWRNAKERANRHLYNLNKIRAIETQIALVNYVPTRDEQDFLDASRRELWLAPLRIAAMIVAAVLLVVAVIRVTPIVYKAYLRQQAMSPMVSFPDSYDVILGTGNRTYFVPAFSLDQYEVSRAQYHRCYLADECSEEGSMDENSDLPITSVSAYEAATFCRWLGRRLPSVVEWERAVRGTDGRDYPWGDARLKPNAERVNAPTLEDLTFEPTGLVEVDALPDGATREGRIYNLFGNAIEWTRTPFSCHNVYTCDSLWDGMTEIDALYTVDSGWQNMVENITFGQPIEMDADFALDDVGFRCASDG